MTSLCVEEEVVGSAVSTVGVGGEACAADAVKVGVVNVALKSDWMAAWRHSRVLVCASWWVIDGD